MNIKNIVRYPFVPLENDGAFFFVTDKGRYYTVEVSNTHQRFDGLDILKNSGQTFEIAFRRVFDDKENLYDSSVSATILHILTFNILSRGDTPTYFFVCDYK